MISFRHKLVLTLFFMSIGIDAMLGQNVLKGILSINKVNSPLIGGYILLKQNGAVVNATSSDTNEQYTWRTLPRVPISSKWRV